MLWSAIWLGIAAGAVHAGTGPDHVAGVAPFAARRGRAAWKTGAAWGIGHAGGALASAAVALALRAHVPGVEESLSAWSERIVGVLLCLIGALGLRRILRAPVLAGAAGHAHAEPPASDRSVFGLGLVHGAAGLSHLFGTLPALALPGTLLPAVFLAGYGAGSLAVITVFAAGIGHFAPASEPRLRRRVVAFACASSLAIGLLWLVHPI
ncbi:MAG: hypothetical protein NTY35_13085 [Planctomycetota bacterium]|nr:hypothetical protein [Planctomycetota bacterium]